MRSYIACGALFCGLLVGIPVVLVVEPFHSLKAVQVPNALAIKKVPFVNLTGMPKEPEGPLVHMPVPVWPKAPALANRSHRAVRPAFWCMFMLLVALGTCIVGTGILISGPKMQRRLSEYMDVVLFGQAEEFALGGAPAVRGVLCGVAVVGHLSIVTKLVITSAFSGTLAAGLGLDYEGWALILLYGSVWLLAQAGAVVYARGPSASFGPTAFVEAQCTTMTPFLSDPFDTVKDAMFGGIALAHHSWISKAIGGISLAYLWLLHFYMLYDPELRHELEGAYLSVLLMNPERATGAHSAEAEAFVAAQGSEEEHHRPAQQGRPPPVCCTKGCCAVPMPVLQIVFKQTLPEYRRALAAEDTPQALLAVAYSLATQAANPQVLLLNLGIPLLRYVFAWLSYPYLVRRPDVLSWLFEELKTAEDANNKGRVQFCTQHLKTGLDSAPATTYARVLEKLLGQPDVEERFVEFVVRLEGKDFGDKGAVGIAAWLATNTSLQRLALASSGIRLAGAKALAGALRVNRVLRKLELHFNGIGDAGAEALAGALKANEALEVLDLEFDHIGNAGAEALAEALRGNRALRQLNLNDNHIGDAGAEALAEALRSNRTLRVLSLGGFNRVSRSTRDRIDVVLRSRTPQA